MLIAWSLVRWYRQTPASADPGPGLSWRWQVSTVSAVGAAGLFAWWSVRGLVAGADDLYGLRELLYGGLTRSVALMAFVVLVAALVSRPVLATRE